MSINMHYQCILRERLDRLVKEVWDDPAVVERYVLREGEERWEKPDPTLWTEANWVGLHSLLIWGEWANQPLLGAAILGGTPIGWGYCYSDEPVRYFTVEQVREVAAALQTVQEDALRRSCDPAALNAVGAPPVGGWREGDFEYLWKTFCDIRDFFRAAQIHNDAMLIYLC
jgi:hypothetical protein